MNALQHYTKIQDTHHNTYYIHNDVLKKHNISSKQRVSFQAGWELYQESVKHTHKINHNAVYVHAIGDGSSNKRVKKNLEVVIGVCLVLGAMLLLLFLGTSYHV